MIRSMRTALTAAVLGVTAVAGWAADEPAQTSSARENNQDARIQEGVDKGQLTQREAKRLNREQNAVEKAQQRAHADGKVTEREQQRLNKLQNKTSKDIKRQRHDKADAK